MIGALFAMACAFSFLAGWCFGVERISEMIQRRKREAQAKELAGKR